jgi:hypothetical protein
VNEYDKNKKAPPRREALFIYFLQHFAGSGQSAVGLQTPCSHLALSQHSSAALLLLFAIKIAPEVARSVAPIKIIFFIF